jgi:hypothetical protein
MNSREIAQEVTQRARLPQHLEAVTKAKSGVGSEIGTWNECFLSAVLEDLVQNEDHRQQIVARLLDMKRERPSSGMERLGPDEIVSVILLRAQFCKCVFHMAHVDG